MSRRMFQHIRKTPDPQLGMNRLTIVAGQYYVSSEEEVVCTILGSCVCATVYDPIRKMGGMNHFMHPGAGPAGPTSRPSPTDAYYGQAAMSGLIDYFTSQGSRKEGLIVKLFGGGSIQSEKLDGVGSQNLEFAQSYLASRGITLAASDLGGPFPRKVEFFPVSGKIRMKRLRSIQKEQIAAQESAATKARRRSR